MKIVLLIKRHMKQTQNFSLANGAARSDDGAGPSEELIGKYTNPDPKDGAILFTSERMLIISGGRESSVKYEDILDFDIPRDKTHGSVVVLRTTSNIVNVVLRGRYGHPREYPDAFLLVRVLHAMLSPRKRPSSGAP